MLSYHCTHGFIKNKYCFYSFPDIDTPTFKVLLGPPPANPVSTTKEQINEAFIKESKGKLKNILEVCDEPLVSVDFKQNSSSCIIDALSTEVINGNMVKIVGWYDNEWGYSCRTADMVSYVTNVK